MSTRERKPPTRFSPTMTGPSHNAKPPASRSVPKPPAVVPAVDDKTSNFPHEVLKILTHSKALGIKNISRLRAVSRSEKSTINALKLRTAVRGGWGDPWINELFLNIFHDYRKRYLRPGQHDELYIHAKYGNAWMGTFSYSINVVNNAYILSLSHWAYTDKPDKRGEYYNFEDLYECTLPESLELPDPASHDAALLLLLEKLRGLPMYNKKPQLLEINADVKATATKRSRPTSLKNTTNMFNKAIGAPSRSGILGGPTKLETTMSRRLDKFWFSAKKPL